ncbi:MAG: hypothetical protein LBP32_05935 [Spirochaetaceae bacterium]|jgi:hypothetical protein|nr:hypothetical protein [Spirochaetaceae bacterium]
MTVNLSWNKNHPNGKIIVVFALFFSALSLCAQDYGLMIRQSPVLTGGETATGKNTGAAAHVFSYTGTAVPWFAAPLGEQGDVYLSGGISAEYSDEAWKPVPEVYRFECIYNPNPDVCIEVGRVPFRENLSYVFAGLFDGAAARFNLGGGWLSAGIFYTGLLYKKTAYIVMGTADRENYYDKDIYFASRRLAFGIHWEKTNMFDTRNTLYLGGLGQFDLNGGDTKVHTQYLEGRLDIPLGNSFNLQTGGVVEVIEKNKHVSAAFALSADLQWLPPGAWRDMFTLGGRFSSGAWNERTGAFLPITSQAQGKVLRPELSGIALIQSSYTARFHEAFSANLSAAYFLRTDETTYSHPGMEASTRSPLLGGEIYGGFIWAPWSDLSVSAGGGVFFPQWGRYFEKDAGLSYRITLEAVFSF